MTGYRIRPFIDTDRAALGALSHALQEAEREMEPNRARWLDAAGGYAEAIVGEVAASDGAIFLAESVGPEAGEAVGYVTCWHGYEDDRIIAEPARHYLYVSDLYVADAWRGKGVAGALIEAAAAHGRALKLDQMRIGVLAINAAARGAYAKAGFEEYEMVLRKQL
jgi:ribosomal protein S18 acetylase RimI-like enzyme